MDKRYFRISVKTGRYAGGIIEVPTKYILSENPRDVTGNMTFSLTGYGSKIGATYAAHSAQRYDKNCKKMKLGPVAIDLIQIKPDGELEILKARSKKIDLEEISSSEASKEEKRARIKRAHTLTEYVI